MNELQFGVLNFAKLSRARSKLKSARQNAVGAFAGQTVDLDGRTHTNTIGAQGEHAGNSSSPKRPVRVETKFDEATCEMKLSPQICDLSKHSYTH